MLHAVIMAGGSGTRFWPLSRTDTPKQLLNLAGSRTMIQQAYDRCLGQIAPQNIWVVTNCRQVEATRNQLPELKTEHFLAEPVARNTAPCIGLAAIHLLDSDPEAVMLVMPADHVIEPVENFQKAVHTACQLVKKDAGILTLFGVIPYFPSTGFGYIERGEELQRTTSPVFTVRSFREKPDYHTATEYLKRGLFFWNCGIFVWSAQTILDAIREHEPKIHRRLMTIARAIGTPQYEAVLEREFQQCPSISIDYGVLERAENIAVVEALFDWDDVGSWQALHRLLGADENGNTIIGQHLGVETSQCIVRSSENHLIATLGVKNCIIVHTPDATLVASKEDENAIKQVVDALRAQGFESLL